MICTWAFNIAFKNWYPSLTSYSQKKLCSKLLSIQRVTFTWAAEKRSLYSKVVCRYTRLLLCATFVFPSGTWILWYFKKAVKYLVIVFCINRTGFLWSLLSIKRVPQLCHTRHSFWDTSQPHVQKPSDCKPRPTEKKSWPAELVGKTCPSVLTTRLKGQDVISPSQLESNSKGKNSHKNKSLLPMTEHQVTENQSISYHIRNEKKVVWWYFCFYSLPSHFQLKAALGWVSHL